MAWQNLQQRERKEKERKKERKKKTSKAHQNFDDNTIDTGRKISIKQIQ
jgi:hypothetical protein